MSKGTIMIFTVEQFEAAAKSKRFIQADTLDRLHYERGVGGYTYGKAYITRMMAATEFVVTHKMAFWWDGAAECDNIKQGALYEPWNILGAEIINHDGEILRGYDLQAQIERAFGEGTYNNMMIDPAAIPALLFN